MQEPYQFTCLTTHGCSQVTHHMMNDFIYDRAAHISFLGYYNMNVDMQHHQMLPLFPTFLYLICSSWAGARLRCGHRQVIG